MSKITMREMEQHRSRRAAGMALTTAFGLVVVGACMPSQGSSRLSALNAGQFWGFGSSAAVVHGHDGATASPVIFAGVPGLVISTNMKRSPADRTFIKRIALKPDDTVASDSVVASDKKGHLGAYICACPDLNGDGWSDVVATYTTSASDSDVVDAALLVLSGRDGSELGRYLCPKGSRRCNNIVIAERVGAERRPLACFPTMLAAGKEFRVDVVDIATLRRAALLESTDASYVLSGGMCIIPEGADGAGSLAVGAASRNSNESGRVYLYHLSGFTLAGRVDGPAGCPRFGSAIAIRDARAKWSDLQLVVGAPNRSPGATVAGDVYCVFPANGTVAEKLTAPLGSSTFGDQITSLGDLDRDGLNDFAVHSSSLTSDPFQQETYTIFSGKTLKPIGDAVATMLCRLDAGDPSDEPVILIGQTFAMSNGVVEGEFRSITAANLLR